MSTQIVPTSHDIVVNRNIIFVCLEKSNFDFIRSTFLSQLLKGRHVMVRVGGGWDTLSHYLSTHDPCRIIRFPKAGVRQASPAIKTMDSSSYSQSTNLPRDLDIRGSRYPVKVQTFPEILTSESHQRSYSYAKIFVSRDSDRVARDEPHH